MKGYPTLALLVLIDRTTCQLTEESFTASSGLQFFVFCHSKEYLNFPIVFAWKFRGKGQFSVGN